MAYPSSKKLIPCFCPFLKVFKTEFLIQDFISQLIVNENGRSTYQSLSLGVEPETSQISNIGDIVIV